MSPRSPNERSAEAGEVVRDLLVRLVRSKQYLAYQYASWCIRSPSIEANIALAGMAQEELGHGTVLGGLLDERSSEKDALVTWERWSNASGGLIESWPGMIVTCLARDAAATATLEALQSSAHPPLAQRARKMVLEEQFHLMFCLETARGLAGVEGLAATYRRALEQVEAGLGAGETLARLAALGTLPAGAIEARARVLDSVSRQLHDALSR